MNKKLTNMLHFYLWFPELFCSTGGIQTYSNFLFKACQKINPNFKYEVFLKNDAILLQSRFAQSARYANAIALAKINHQAHIKWHFTGDWQGFLRTVVFAIKVIGYGIYQRPNLVISSHLNFTVAAYWLKKIAGVPYWAVAHGVEAWDIESQTLKTALQDADQILAVSNYTRDRLLKEQNIDPSKIVVLPNTFDAERFQINSKPEQLLKRYKLTPNQPIILTVARLASSEAYKGYDKILQALPDIRTKIPNVHYILVGKGSDRTRIETLITELSLQDCVTLAGFVPDEELCDHYNLCDVFAMPSKGEGFGIVYLEALACGKPTLGGNQDGAIDALCNGELGVLVNPDDLQDIAQSLIQILQGTYPNPLIYQPEVLRQKVSDYFGFEQFKKTLEGYLNKWILSTNTKK